MLHNAELPEVIITQLYEDAFFRVREYDELEGEARKKATEPKGKLVDRVRGNQLTLLKEDAAAHDARVGAEGRD